MTGVTEKFDLLILVDGTEYVQKGQINARYNHQGYLVGVDFVVENDETDEEWEYEIPVHSILMLSRVIS